MRHCGQMRWGPAVLAGSIEGICQGSERGNEGRFAVALPSCSLLLQPDISMPMLLSSPLHWQVAAFVEGRRCTLSALVDQLMAAQQGHAAAAAAAAPPHSQLGAVAAAAEVPAAAAPPATPGLGNWHVGAADSSPGAIEAAGRLRAQLVELATRKSYATKDAGGQAYGVPNKALWSIIMLRMRPRACVGCAVCKGHHYMTSSCTGAQGCKASRSC